MFMQVSNTKGKMAGNGEPNPIGGTHFPNEAIEESISENTFEHTDYRQGNVISTKKSSHFLKNGIKKSHNGHTNIKGSKSYRKYPEIGIENSQNTMNTLLGGENSRTLTHEITPAYQASKFKWIRTEETQPNSLMCQTFHTNSRS